MKILFVHNRYQQAGGEDNVVAAEADLLAKHGHDIELWSVDNKDLPAGFTGKIKTALATSYSASSLEIARGKLAVIANEPQKKCMQFTTHIARSN